MKKQLIALGAFIVLGLGALPSLAACPCHFNSCARPCPCPAAPCCPAPVITPCCPAVRPCCPPVVAPCCPAPCAQTLPCPCPAAPIQAPCCEDRNTCDDCCD